MSMHIESAIHALQTIDDAHSYADYDEHSTRNQVDGLLDKAFDHVMKAQTHDERGDYKAAHASLLAGTKSAAQAHSLLTTGSSTVRDLSLVRPALEQSVIGYKHENFS